MPERESRYIPRAHCHRHYDRVAWVPERLSGTSEVSAAPRDERALRRCPVIPGLSAGWQHQWLNGLVGLASEQTGIPARITLYWRPGCMFCRRLRFVLWWHHLSVRQVNIWRDPDAAAFVRSVAGGNETVPTVVIDGRPLVNPAPRQVIAAVRPG
jgi:mycoredoxin